MTLSEQYIKGLEVMLKQREDVLQEFQHKVVDLFKNMVAEYSREQCHLVSVDELVEVAAMSIEKEMQYLKRRDWNWI